MALHCLVFKEMTLNKMVWNFWHQFLIRFSMLFQMVPFILLCMVAHLTITWLVETIPTANQRALCWGFLKLPWREKRKVPERAMNPESKTGVKSDTPLYSRLPIEKTNSACAAYFWNQKQHIEEQNDSILHSYVFWYKTGYWNAPRSLTVQKPCTCRRIGLRIGFILELFCFIQCLTRQPNSCSCSKP